jgi:hypothetical protein
MRNLTKPPNSVRVVTWAEKYPVNAWGRDNCVELSHRRLRFNLT